LEVEYLPDFTGIAFAFERTKYSTKLLGKHNAKNIALALSVARELGVPVQILQEVVKQLEFVPHRLEVLHNARTGITVIDDAFNGNKEGVISTIDLLRKTAFRGRKIYLTPGLVELGEMADKVHLEIGNILVGAVDMVLLIENESTLKIKEGLLLKGFDKKKIQLFPNALEAHQALGGVLQKGDIVVFQNDLTDNYG
jgi:UDP-N-acetylmuramoyl-tripeptide--D-alanyl-D-alanine ligase